jgi:hypothetical protein
MLSRRLLILGSIVGSAALALLATGCGGGGSASPQVAIVATSTTTITTAAGQSGLVAYAHCMRTHGVTGFPDPDSTGGIPKLQVVDARQRNPSRFDAADNACRSLLPNESLAPQETPQQQRVRLADGLSFARCMRSHGLTNFPDPTAQGQLTVEMVEAQGIDVHSPSVLRVVQTCLPASHGALTPAKVREAINNAGH